MSQSIFLLVPVTGVHRSCQGLYAYVTEAIVHLYRISTPFFMWKIACVRAGEFEPHEGCWMGWPESEDSQYLWRQGGEPARGAYANVAKAISQFEPLYMVANPGEAAANARKVFEDAPNVNVVEVPINDGWTRDWGPSVSHIRCQLVSPKA